MEIVRMKYVPPGYVRVHARLAYGDAKMVAAAIIAEGRPAVLVEAAGGKFHVYVFVKKGM